MKRCPRGSRRNKVSGNCEPNLPSKPRGRCPKGSRRSKVSGNCEPRESLKKTPISQDKSSEFNAIIRTSLLPVLHDLFHGYKKTDDFLQPTSHLYSELNQSPFELLEDGFTRIYRIGVFDDNEYQVVLQINKNSFALLIVPLSNFENTSRTTNISCSPDRKNKMYIYGIKANGDGPKVSGNVLNQTIMLICKEMCIPQLYISDSAGVKCFWDDRIEIQHFSLLRVMIGKPTFYSSLPGHFFDPEEATKEITMLQKSTDEEDKAYIRHYLTFQPPKGQDDCNRLNHIISKGMDLLGPNPAIFKFVATPYIHTGGRKTRRKRNNKYTRTK
jgi:hypothetical protein